MPKIYDAIGNELREGMLVQVKLDNGGFVIGKVRKIDYGGAIALAKSPLDKGMVMPTQINIITDITMAVQPGAAIRDVLALREPKEAPAIAGASS